MAKIVIDAREYATSTGRYVSRLIHYLEVVDRENEYLILLKPADMTRYQPTNPHFQAVACPYKEFTFAEQTRLLKQVMRLKADLVHFAVTQQPIFYRAPHVTTIHDLTTARFLNLDKKRTVFLVKQLVYKFVIKRVARTSAAVITPTQFVKHDVAAFSHIASNKIVVTYEAADRITALSTPLPNLQKNDFIMYLGRPTPHKNLPRLIEAYRQLQFEHPTLTLVLAGKQDANYRRIAASVDQQGIKGVYFTDFVSEGQLRWLYENCAAYIFPSLSEGFGLPGLEAMRHGAPVVSSDATCLPEVYGPAAHYFDPTDASAMADAINDVLTDQALSARLVIAGYQRADGYSWERMAKDTLAVYKQVLKQA
jgi:glycosyltransferase involved in cell wall biosynthesis